MKGPEEHELPQPAEGVIARSFGDEYVLYGQDTNRAASLTGVSAQVWREAEGGAPPHASPEEVSVAVEELTKLGFLQTAISRRTVLIGAASAGASAVCVVVTPPHRPE